MAIATRVYWSLLLVLAILVTPAIAQRGSQEIPYWMRRVDRTTAFLSRMTPMQREHSKLYEVYKTSDKILDLAISAYIPEKSFFSEPDRVIPDRSRRLEEMVCSSDLVVDGSIVEGVSNPIDDGTFLFTDYSVRVGAVLSARGASASPNDLLVVTRPGGEVKIDVGVVKASVGEFPLLQPGKRYVLFMDRVRTTGAFRSVLAEGTFAVTQGVLEPLVPLQIRAGTDRDALSIRSFAESINRITCR